MTTEPNGPDQTGGERREAWYMRDLDELEARDLTELLWPQTSAEESKGSEHDPRIEPP